MHNREESTDNVFSVVFLFFPAFVGWAEYVDIVLSYGTRLLGFGAALFVLLYNWEKWRKIRRQKKANGQVER